jgi:hypothetical protein
MYTIDDSHILRTTHIKLLQKTLQLKTRPGYKQTGHITLHQSREGTTQHGRYRDILHMIRTHKNEV